MHGHRSDRALGLHGRPLGGRLRGDRWPAQPDEGGHAAEQGCQGAELRPVVIATVNASLAATAFPYPGAPPTALHVAPGQPVA